MAWPERRIDSWDNFIAIATHLEFGPAATFAYLYRGQSQFTWTLEPTLVRVLPKDIDEARAVQTEEDCYRLFMERAHLHFTPKEIPETRSRPEWWALMRHYGAPTRLLDWTTSIYVAAYFAAVDDWGTDGAIWLFHARSLIEQLVRDLSWRSRAKTLLRGAQPDLGLHVFRPLKLSQRIDVQQGRLVYQPRLLSNMADFIDARLGNTHASGKGEAYRKLVIPAQVKPLIIRHLRAMNITAVSLFPGGDGLGRATHELAKLSTVYPRSIDVPQ